MPKRFRVTTVVPAENDNRPKEPTSRRSPSSVRPEGLSICTRMPCRIAETGSGGEGEAVVIERMRRIDDAPVSHGDDAVRMRRHVGGVRHHHNRHARRPEALD